LQNEDLLLGPHFVKCPHLCINNQANVLGLYTLSTHTHTHTHTHTTHTCFEKYNKNMNVSRGTFMSYFEHSVRSNTFLLNRKIKLFLQEN